MPPPVALAPLVLAAALGGCVSTEGLPPLWEHEDGLPGDAVVTRAAFGLYEKRIETDGTELRTVRPLMTARSATDEAESFHVLPPLYESADATAGRGRRVFPLYFETDRGTPQQRDDGTANEDTWLFPLFAWGSDPAEGSYFLFLPFGGTLKGKFLADRIDVYLFPIYITTRAAEWSSTHVLWPLIAWGSGPQRSHFRVMPFWSQTDGERTHRRSLLWPIFHWSDERRGDREFSGWMVFPLVGRRAADDGSSAQWTFLYPFFQIARDDTTGDSYTALPWPIYKRSVRPGVEDSTWIWPFWGHTETEDVTSTFWLWPIGWNQTRRRGAVEAHRTYVVPLYMRSTTGPIGEDATAVAERSWPLYSYDRDESGHEQVRVPDLIPVFGWEPGERVYSDFLAIVRWERDARGVSAWDGPLGIVGYRHREDGSSALRLLWWFEIPLGDGR